MIKTVLLCIIVLVAIFRLFDTFVTNIQRSIPIAWNQYNNYNINCASRKLSVNKSDIIHDKDLALYNCNNNKSYFENIKHHRSISFQRRHSLQINCDKLFNGDKLEFKKAVTVKLQNNDLGNKRITSSFHECKTYISQFGYITYSLSKEEQDFPIAYSIVMYKDEQQFEKLLRAIYRPQNHYCVHVDLSAKWTVYEFVKNVTKCFSNVHLAERRIDVKWGKFSVLEADLICMKQLLRHKDWKYYINLTGQEFPLRTNSELVKILKAYRGANDIKGIVKR